MSDEEKKEEIEVPPQDFKPDLPNEEEEPVDEELKKKMKDVKIDDSVFSGEHKKNEKKKHDKKNSKKKGIDFMEYASKNNIQVNIEYEEDKYEKNKNYYDNNNNRKYNNNNRKYDNKGKNYNKKGYNKNNNNNNNNQNRPYKFGGNKFDSFNQKPNFENHFYQPKFNDDNEIKNFIENLFTEHTLNKVIYLRYKLNDKGQILIDDLANYNALKKNNVDSNKIIDLIKDSNNLEKVEIDGKNYINVKNFSQLNLLTIEQINENKKQMRMNDRMQQNMFQNQMGFIPYGFNYAQMQNFMPNQQFNPIQPQNMNMQPQPFNNNNNNE